MTDCVKCSACGDCPILDREVFVGIAKFAVFCRNERCRNAKQTVGGSADYFDSASEAAEKWNNMHAPQVT